MDLLAILLAKVIGTFAILALFIYVGCRAVGWAKKRSLGGELVGCALMLFNFGGALNPAREVAVEQRKLKRSEEGSGDPNPHPDDAE